MIALLISSIYLLFISLVTGQIFSKKFGFSPGIIEKVLIGIAFSNSILSIISLFSQITPFISLIYFVICLLLFFSEYKSILNFSAIRYKPQNLFFLTFPIVIIFGFINSLYYPVVFDSGLYHIQAIEWIENYPVIPGLANLHGRFGFNPNIFVLFAATSFDGIFKNEVFSINFVVYCIIAIWLLKRMYKFMQSKFYYLAIIFIVVLIMLINSAFILSSPTPDFISYFFPFFIFLRFIEIKTFEKNNDFSVYYPIIILSLYVLTVKLSALPVLLLIPLILYQNREIILRKDLYILILCGLIIMTPWLIRNVILTGWIIYPFAGIDLFNFDWKIPKSEVIDMSKTITAWGRNPGKADFMESAGMTINQWFPLWWAHKTEFKQIIFTIICTTPFIVFGLIIFQKLKGVMKSYRSVYFIAFLGFIFWFFISPDWRYGLPFLVLPLVTPLLFIKYPINLKSKYLINISSVLIISYTVFFNLTSMVEYLNLTPVDFVINNFEKVEFVTDKIRRLSIQRQEVKFDSYKIDNKLEVKYPVNDYRCFDEELPCSSFLVKKIHLRGESLRQGFYKE